MKEINNLELHESINIDQFLSITRVIGGYLYKTTDYTQLSAGADKIFHYNLVFVPSVN